MIVRTAEPVRDRLNRLDAMIRRALGEAYTGGKARGQSIVMQTGRRRAFDEGVRQAGRRRPPKARIEKPATEEPPDAAKPSGAPGRGRRRNLTVTQDRPRCKRSSPALDQQPGERRNPEGRAAQQRRSSPAHREVNAIHGLRRPGEPEPTHPPARSSTHHPARSLTRPARRRAPRCPRRRRKKKERQEAERPQARPRPVPTPSRLSPAMP